MALEQENAPTPSPPSGFKRYAFLVLCLLLVSSVGARALFVSSSSTPAGTPPTAASAPDANALAPQGLVAGDQDGVPPIDGESGPGTVEGGAGTEPEPTPLETALPYLTEGSFFALIGFALGYASRKVVKLGLILLALVFVGLQGLSYLEVIQIDWNRAIEVLNNLILNLNENQTVTEVLKDRLPTVGGFGAGYLLGFRKG